MIDLVETVAEDLDLKPISSALGAEVRGVNLSQPLPEAVISDVRSALDVYGVLLFREQCLSPEVQISISQRFGPLQEVAQKQYQLAGQPFVYVIGNVEENGRAIGDPSVGRLWHSDQSFKPYPAFGSLLHGLQCPAEGADTLFANMYTAYEALPPAMQTRIETLHAVHSFQDYYEMLRDRDPTQPPLTEERRDLYPDVQHPLVRRNPRTGRRALYINPGYAMGIAELPGEDGAKLLHELCDHAQREDFVYAHAWRKGDVVFWNNLAVNHKGTAFDTERYIRRMHRTTIASDRASYQATLL